MKNYQTTTRRARTVRTTPKKARPDAARSAHERAVALPDTVTVAIAELAGELEEGLLAFVVGTGLKVSAFKLSRSSAGWRSSYPAPRRSSNPALLRRGIHRSGSLFH
jgi:hypothetical protein